MSNIGAGKAADVYGYRLKYIIAQLAAGDMDRRL
jgi:hypothetical protein